MNLLDLISEPSGRLSHTKAEALLSFVVVTILFARHSWIHGVNVGLLTAYAATYAAGRAVSKISEVKTGTGNGNGDKT